MLKVIRIASVSFACAVFAVILLFLIPSRGKLRVIPHDALIDRIEDIATRVPPDFERHRIYTHAAREAHNRELLEAKSGAYVLATVAGILAALVIGRSFLEPRSSNQSPQRNAGIGPATLDGASPPRPALSSEETASPQSPRG
jgi:hypothetical protein